MTRLLGWLVVVLAGAAAGLVGVGAPACACSCVPMTEDEAYNRADAVFAATLVNRDEPGKLFSSADPVELMFAVDAVYKGDVGAAQRVVTAQSSASCGLEVEVGKRYLVHADSTGGQLEASLCGGTRTLAGTPVVGGTTPVAVDGATVPAGDDGGDPAWPLFAGGALLVLVLTGVGFLIARRLRADHGTPQPDAV